MSILDINNLLHSGEMITESKYEVYKFSSNLTTEEKLMLDRGDKVDVIFKERSHKMCTIKYNFVDDMMNVIGVRY